MSGLRGGLLRQRDRDTIKHLTCVELMCLVRPPTACRLVEVALHVARLGLQQEAVPRSQRDEAAKKHSREARGALEVHRAALFYRSYARLIRSWPVRRACMFRGHALPQHQKLNRDGDRVVLIQRTITKQ